MGRPRKDALPFEVAEEASDVRRESVFIAADQLEESNDDLLQNQEESIEEDENVLSSLSRYPEKETVKEPVKQDPPKLSTLQVNGWHSIETAPKRKHVIVADRPNGGGILAENVETRRMQKNQWHISYKWVDPRTRMRLPFQPVWWKPVDGQTEDKNA